MSARVVRNAIGGKATGARLRYAAGGSVVRTIDTAFPDNRTTVSLSDRFALPTQYVSAVLLISLFNDAGESDYLEVPVA